MRTRLAIITVICLCSVACSRPETVVTVAKMNLNRTILSLPKGHKDSLSVIILPVNAANKNLNWYSSDDSVVSVENGIVSAIADGEAIISVVTEDQGLSDTCRVIVYSSIDYVDEYGVNHGPGVKIGKTVWAPVNCGFHETDYKWGKLYQWGRKYGQGYTSYREDIELEQQDACAPKIVAGPISEAEGNHIDNANVFYYKCSDWVDVRNDKLWNAGSEESPIKTEYDPCPQGWRVPSFTELKSVLSNSNPKEVSMNGFVGHYFSGEYSYSPDAPQIIIPSAGDRSGISGDVSLRVEGCYWSSMASNNKSATLDKISWDSFSVHLYSGGRYGEYNQIRSDGLSVRCVME